MKVPTFKLAMSYTEFENAWSRVMDIVGEKNEKIKMKDSEKQKSVITRMIDNDMQHALLIYGMGLTLSPPTGGFFE